jgi:hypothetical protein
LCLYGSTSSQPVRAVFQRPLEGFNIEFANASCAPEGSIEMRTVRLICAATSLLAASFGAADAQYRSSSGPRGPAGDVPSAPVDRRGPTLAPDTMLLPDSGWNQRSSGGANGPNYTMTQPLFGPPLPTLPRPRRHPRIILEGE